MRVVVHEQTFCRIRQKMSLRLLRFLASSLCPVWRGTASWETLLRAARRASASALPRLRVYGSYKINTASFLAPPQKQPLASRAGTHTPWVALREGAEKEKKNMTQEITTEQVQD